MKSWALGLVAALVLHFAVLLFGGIFFLKDDAEHAAEDVQDIDILTQDEPEDEKKDEEQDLEKVEADEVQEPQETPPDMQQLVEIAQREQPALADETPALEALSLAALESALGPGAFGGDFGSAFSLTSGGRIGGTAAAGAASDEEAAEMVFDITEIDQKARALFQSPPAYPVELRKRKIEGTVLVQFVVDAKGRVINPKIESSSSPEFERPALEAVRQWKFEPAVRAGEKVPSKMRVPIRFNVAS